MTFEFDKVKRWVDLAIAAEVHAILMMFIGAILVAIGHSEEGKMMLMTAAAVFRGGKT